MKIIFFSRLFYPHIGGVEIHVLRLSEELLKLGHSVEVVTEQYSKNLPLVDNYKGIIIYRIPIVEGWLKKFYVWNWVIRHKKMFKRGNILHAHDVYFWLLPLKLFNPRLKIYTTFHGYEGTYPVSKKAIIIRKLSEFGSYKTIAVGEFIKKWYFAKPDNVIYGGIDSKEKAHDSQINNKTTNIIFLGRLEQVNQVKLYADALELLHTKKFPHTFTAVGDGSFRSTLSQYGKVTGFIENAESYIRKADVVFTSSYLSILQSLSLCKEVMAVYDNPLKKDYLEMTPFADWITIVDNPISLTRAIINSSKKKKRLSPDAISWLKLQNWSKIASLYLKLWK